MHGNLWEWCRDRFQEKPQGGADPENVTGSAQRVLRGACWNNTGKGCRATARHENDPDYQSYGYGFRVAIVRTTGAGAGAGPVSLFDGRSLNGWRGLESEKLPAGWRVEDESIVGPGNKTYLATADSYTDFELELQWKLARSANAGIFYRWGGELRAPEAGLGDPLAPEYRIVDNANHPNGKKPETATGSGFSLIAPTKDATKPFGQWNTTRLVVRGPHVEHWLNGEKIVEYDYGSADWNRRVAAHPRLSHEPNYARPARGRIVLQSYSGRVWYRDIRIKATDGLAPT